MEDPVTWEYFDINFIRFVVMRGLNLDETSHGIIGNKLNRCIIITSCYVSIPGQFWNVPVTVAPFDGEFDGVERDDDYVITVSHPHAVSRSFVGLKADVTWEFEERVCYYVGNTQAGQLAEVTEPNDSVIEGNYREYKVDSLFATSYVHSRFEASC